MKKNRLVYNFINLAVILLTVALFILRYLDIGKVFEGISAVNILIILAVAVVVHSIKAIRLYLALYGSGMRFGAYIKTYCKVTPVSLVIPLKLGEFFRMYCYGRSLGNVLKGVVIIIMDRFMDTAALVSMILLVLVFTGGHMTAIAYVLLLFLLIMLLMYLAYPGVSAFWKKMLLRGEATERNLSALRFIEVLNNLYGEIKNVSRGRGIIMFFLSIASWAAELFGLTLLLGAKGGELSESISNYLAAALGNGESAEMTRFIFIGVVLLMIVYIIVKCTELISVGKAKK